MNCTDCNGKGLTSNEVLCATCEGSGQIGEVEAKHVKAKRVSKKK